MIQKIKNFLFGNWIKKEQSKDYICGVLDLNSGEFKRGFVTNNNSIRYESDGFSKVWDDPVFISSTVRTQKYLSSKLFGEDKIIEDKQTVGVYFEENLISKDKRYFIGSISNREYIEKDAYEKDRTIIITNS